ncbi:hypothetical protein PHYPSEUDO_006654 [Phytophthora pseudosyringae]|uniref:Uncharacterized protein n=1 Tax=Phytophthora pseudosyringae TaxID=221518 RepID=A0A8T1WA01_9STRA|nr:hypothetical protein PHYPSEUDO_006654 [Phytophthora pseudosyringae]
MQLVQNGQYEELKSMEGTTKGWVNLLLDLWQNISKTHLLACQLALFGVMLTYGLLPAGDEHHGEAISAQLEEVITKAKQDKWRVGESVTDNAGQCGRARRILALRWFIAFLFCFAHGMNNLAEAVLRPSFEK